MIGGPNSNNLVGLAQLLRENEIAPIAFVREAADRRRRGNALLLEMLLSPDELRFVPRSKWNDVESIALQELGALDKPTHLLLEGCYGFPALPGSLSLAEDILRNEIEANTYFERIYIDCGTGLSAIGLILGLESLASRTSTPREVVVTLIAENEAGFHSKLEQMRTHLLETFPLKRENQISIRFLKPVVSPKFGSINQSLFRECVKIARTTGLIMDPVYSVKHYARALEDYTTTENRPTNPLFIFNGSALGTSGFQDKLDQSINSL